MAGCTLSAAATDARSIGVAKAIVTASESSRSVENVVANAAWLSGHDRIGAGRDGCRRLTGTQDADTEDESQAECEADPGQGRASHDCADAGRTGNGDGQQRNGGLTQ